MANKIFDKLKRDSKLIPKDSNENQKINSNYKYMKQEELLTR